MRANKIFTPNKNVQTFGDNAVLKLIGLPEKEEANELIQLMADRLHNLAPSDARLVIEIESEGDFYYGLCKVRATHLNLDIKSYARTPLQAMKILERKTKLQIDLWKRQRKFS